MKVTSTQYTIRNVASAIALSAFAALAWAQPGDAAAAASEARPTDARSIAYLGSAIRTPAPKPMAAAIGQGPGQRIAAYLQPSPSADLAQRLERRFADLLGGRCALPSAGVDCPSAR